MTAVAGEPLPSSALEDSQIRVVHQKHIRSTAGNADLDWRSGLLVVELELEEPHVSPVLCRWIWGEIRPRNTVPENTPR